MNRTRWLKDPDKICLWLIVSLSLGLVLSDLGDIGLTDEEGWTLVLAQSILHHGLPKVQFPGYEFCPFYAFGKNGLLAYQPWLPFYFAAIGVWLFGKSLFL